MVLTTAAATVSRRRAASGVTLLVSGLASGVLALLTLALAGQIVAAPLRHDEQMFASMGILYRDFGLYRDLGYNHLPNLPILLDGVARVFDVTQPVMAFRWVIVAGWLAAIGLTGVLAWRATASALAAALCCLLLIANPLLGGQAGTLISNNFLPIPFALAGLLVFVNEIDRLPLRPLHIALAGALLAMAIGLKANYVFLIPPFAVAALLLPRHLTLAQRGVRIVLPLLAGGLAGGAPALIMFAADPPGFIDHVIGYHRGPHLAWALRSSEQLSISIRDRLVLALSLWGSGSTVLLAMTIAAIAVQLGIRGWRPSWPVLLAAGLVATGIAISFVPRPAFPQYFTPPLPFAIVLLALLIGAQTAAERRAALPWLASLAALTLAVDGVRLLPGLSALVQPADWTGNRVHRVAAQIAAAAKGGPVATLSPLYALDGGGTVYKALAAGPFVYRVADLMTPAQRQYWQTVSPSTLAAMLDARPPGGILVGEEGALDDALRAYAVRRDYRRVVLSDAATRYGELELYVPTSASMSLPVPMRAATASRPSASSR